MSSGLWEELWLCALMIPVTVFEELVATDASSHWEAEVLHGVRSELL